MAVEELLFETELVRCLVRPKVCIKEDRDAVQDVVRSERCEGTAVTELFVPALSALAVPLEERGCEKGLVMLGDLLRYGAVELVVVYGVIVMYVGLEGLDDVFVDVGFDGRSTVGYTVDKIVFTDNSQGIAGCIGGKIRGCLCDPSLGEPTYGGDLRNRGSIVSGEN